MALFVESSSGEPRNPNIQDLIEAPKSMELNKGCAWPVGAN